MDSHSGTFEYIARLLGIYSLVVALFLIISAPFFWLSRLTIRLFSFGAVRLSQQQARENGIAAWIAVIYFFPALFYFLIVIVPALYSVFESQS